MHLLWLGEYSYSNFNTPYKPCNVARPYITYCTKQFFLNQALGLVYFSKSDYSDSFYLIALSLQDAPKLGLVFPSVEGKGELFDILLILRMICKNSPPLFCTAT